MDSEKTLLISDSTEVSSILSVSEPWSELASLSSNESPVDHFPGAIGTEELARRYGPDRGGDTSCESYGQAGEALARQNGRDQHHTDHQSSNGNGCGGEQLASPGDVHDVSNGHGGGFGGSSEQLTHVDEDQPNKDGYSGNGGQTEETAVRVGSDDDDSTSKSDGSLLRKGMFFSALGGTTKPETPIQKPIIVFDRKDMDADIKKPGFINSMLLKMFSVFGGLRRLQLPVQLSRPSAFGSSASLSDDFVPRCYFMGHPRRGVAVIINNREFTMPNTPYRKGSDYDAATLQKSLLKLGFRVDVWTDLTVKSMLDAVQFYSNMDHSDADCFFLGLLSHGEDGVIFGTDGKINLKNLTTPFRGDKCPTLAGKPKFFVIEACRDRPLDSATEQVGEEVCDYPCDVPVESDFLLAYSTISGHLSWRDAERGSWFVQCFCRVFDDMGTHQETDVSGLLIRVNYQVSVLNEIYVPKDDFRKAQIPLFTSRMSKTFFLRPPRSPLA